MVFYQPQRCLARGRNWHTVYALTTNLLNSCPLAVELWRLLDYNSQTCLCVSRRWLLLFISVAGNQSPSQADLFTVEYEVSH